MAEAFKARFQTTKNVRINNNQSLKDDTKLLSS